MDDNEAEMQNTQSSIGLSELQAPVTKGEKINQFAFF